MSTCCCFYCTWSRSSDEPQVQVPAKKMKCEYNKDYFYSLNGLLRLCVIVRVLLNALIRKINF